MIRIYRLSPWTLLLSFVAFVALLFMSLPIVLMFLSVFLISSALRALLHRKRSSKHSRFEQSLQDPHISSVIKNDKIGPYRIKANPRDPNVIEVLD
jgi:Flp pilus assembly protein TadB